MLKKKKGIPNSASHSFWSRPHPAALTASQRVLNKSLPSAMVAQADTMAVPKSWAHQGLLLPSTSPVSPREAESSLWKSCQCGLAEDKGCRPRGTAAVSLSLLGTGDMAEENSLLEQISSWKKKTLLHAAFCTKWCFRVIDNFLMLNMSPSQEQRGESHGW